METNVSKKLSIEYLMWYIHTRCFSLAFFNPCGIQFIFTKIHLENGCVPHSFWHLGMETNEKRKHRIYLSLAFCNPCGIQFIFTKNHVVNGYVPYGI